MCAQKRLILITYEEAFFWKKRVLGGFGGIVSWIYLLNVVQFDVSPMNFCVFGDFKKHDSPAGHAEKASAEGISTGLLPIA